MAAGVPTPTNSQVTSTPAMLFGQPNTRLWTVEFCGLVADRIGSRSVCSIPHLQYCSYTVVSKISLWACMFRKGGESVCILCGKTRKIHTSFKDGSELVEEYDNDTQQLLVRKRRGNSRTGASGSWEYLVGDAGSTHMHPAASASLFMQESSRNPRCVRVDTPGCFSWTVDNLPYPTDTYRVTADPDTTTIIVSTTNKKYYKRISLPEMVMLKLALDPSRLSWSHQGDILTIQYSKPPALLAQELADARDAMAIRAQEDSAECKQQ